MNLTKYIRYSGASIIFSVNPLYWKVLPWYRNETSGVLGSKEKTYALGFLGLTVRFWIDDGSW